jgi:hypothetical protein
MIDYYYLIPGILIIGFIVYLLLRSPKKTTKAIDVSKITEILDPSNIQKIEFIRNKIVLHTIDINQFDVDTLHQKGALGISIVGDKVKFYFDGGPQKNQDMYNLIKEYLER